MVKAVDSSHYKVKWIVVDNFFTMLFTTWNVSYFFASLYFKTCMLNLILSQGDFFKVAIQPDYIEN